ncbi:MAG: methionyl-tRNA formyltransferase [Alphaproteobacteria bacterium]|nr:methionyl-tRNA formyltransferase [Alphaproteobacteria bacterium]
MDQIVVFLDGARGESVLEALLQARHGVAAVVSRTDKLSEKSRHLVQTHGVPYLVRPDVNAAAAIAELAGYRAKLFLVAGFATLFTEELFALPEHGTINLHGGKLPKYRGGSPLNWQIINGETEAGISVLQLDAGIDTGPVLAEGAIPIGPHDTIADLHRNANAMFPTLVLQCLEELEAGRLVPKVQDETGAEYWHQRNDDDGRLNFQILSAVEADRYIRALTRPYPGAWSLYRGTRVRLFAADFSPFRLKGAPGRIVYLQGDGPFVICRDGALRITRYEIESDRTERLRHGERLA